MSHKRISKLSNISRLEPAKIRQRGEARATKTGAKTPAISREPVMRTAFPLGVLAPFFMLSLTSTVFLWSSSRISPGLRFSFIISIIFSKGMGRYSKKRSLPGGKFFLIASEIVLSTVFPIPSVLARGESARWRRRWWRRCRWLDFVFSPDGVGCRGCC